MSIWSSIKSFFTKPKTTTTTLGYTTTQLKTAAESAAKERFAGVTEPLAVPTRTTTTRRTSGGGGGTAYTPSVSVSVDEPKITTITPTTQLPTERTIFTQLQEPSGPIPSQIGPYYPRPEDWKAPRISMWEGVKGAGRAVVYDVGAFFRGKPMKDPMESFRLIAPLKEEKVAYFEPQVGSAPEAYIPITHGKLQKDIELKRTLEIGEARYKAETEVGKYGKELQKKIDVGEISLKTAEKEWGTRFETQQKEFQKKAEAIYLKSPDIKGIHERTSPLLTGARAIKGLAIYSTPLTSVMALGVETKKAPLAPIDISKPMPLYPDYKTTTGMYVSSGIVGLHAAGMFARGARGMTLGRIESAMEATPIKISGERYILKGKEVLDVGKWKAYGDYSKATGTTISVSKMTGKKVFTEGISDIKVLTKTYWSGKPLVVGGRQAFKIDSKILPKAEGVYPSLSKMTTTPVWEYSLIGKGKDLLKGAKFKGKIYTSIKPSKPELYGGISARRGGYVLGKAGRIKEAYYYYTKGKGFRAGEKMEFRFPEERWSILKEVKPKAKDIFKPSIKEVGKPGTPLSKTFMEQKAISPVRLKQVTKEIYSPTISSPRATIKQMKGVVGKITTRQLTRTIPITTTAIAPVSKQIYRQQPAYALLPKSYLGLSQYLSPRLTESLVSESALRTGQRQLQEQITAPALVTTPSIITPSFKFPFKAGFVFPPIKGARLGSGVKIRTTQLGKQKTAYQPSYTALVLGIKAPKIPKAYRAGAGGLIIRPIITKRKKRRKKK